jgi:alpha-glucosidase
MNSWKPDVAPDWQAATTPWLYPEMLPAIREALHLRTTFLPLMYTLAHLAHRDGSPIIRPIAYDFPEDPRAHDDHDALMLGPDVLFAPVVEEGASTRTQYLPRNPGGWIAYHTGEIHPGGVEVTVAAPLGRPPVFIRSGAALVLAAGTPHVKPHDAPARRLYIAATGPSGTGAGRHIEDDGETWAFRDGDMLDILWRFDWTATAIEVAAGTVTGNRPFPAAADWRVEAPGLAGRRITLRGAQ